MGIYLYIYTIDMDCMWLCAPFTPTHPGIYTDPIQARVADAVFRSASGCHGELLQLLSAGAQLLDQAEGDSSKRIWELINGNFRILKWRYCTI